MLKRNRIITTCVRNKEGTIGKSLQKRYLCGTFPYKCVNTKEERYHFDNNNCLTESRNESRQVELKLLIGSSYMQGVIVVKNCMNLGEVG